jgi:hypothetical protein
MTNRQTHTRQASNQTTKESMNNKQTYKHKNTNQEATSQSNNQTIKNQQSCPFSVHIISAAPPSMVYALNVMEGI